MTNLPESRQSEILVQELADETLIYDLQTNKAYCLNETSSMIWQMCDGNHSFKKASQILSRRLLTPIDEDFIWLALDQFKSDGLLENSKEIEIKFNGLNRRQIIKKVGLASLVALPIMISLIAPTTAMAASCVNPGRSPAGTFLGGTGGVGFCSTPGAGDAACTFTRGSSCCSGRAVSNGTCRDAAPGPNFGTFSVACTCA